MLGRTVYAYLHKQHGTVWGTSRRSDNFLDFNIESVETSLRTIFKKIGKIDYVTNCIGLLQSYQTRDRKPSKWDYLNINSILPHQLGSLASKYDYRLVHISTNAVFPGDARVDESSGPHPENIYGMSKFLGEPDGTDSIRSLTIRSSFVGCDPDEKKGLIELVRQGGKIPGFINQKFSGCTTLQFAQWLDETIRRDRFDKLRKKTSVLHFVPIKGLTKYKLLIEISKLVTSKRKLTITPAKSSEATQQIFTSRYAKDMKMEDFVLPLNQALKQVLEFEENL